MTLPKRLGGFNAPPVRHPRLHGDWGDFAESEGGKRFNSPGKRPDFDVARAAPAVSIPANAPIDPNDTSHLTPAQVEQLGGN
jgi:hypothetical protein